MRRKHPPISEWPTTARIEAFSDGVIAIIITIMVLELHVPQLAETFGREEFFKAFEHLWTKLVAYAMSFVIVAIFWVNHHGFFHTLKKSDGKLLWYNNHLLFWLSLVPFVTAFLGEHPDRPEAIIVFGLVMFFAALAFMLMGQYAMFSGNLMHENYPLEIRLKALRRNYPGLVMYFLSVVLAPVSFWISWVFFFLVPVYYFMPRQVGDNE